jgi:hypothetical protein
MHHNATLSALSRMSDSENSVFFIAKAPCYQQIVASRVDSPNDNHWKILEVCPGGLGA